MKLKLNYSESTVISVCVHLCDTNNKQLYLQSYKNAFIATENFLKIKNFSI